MSPKSHYIMQEGAFCALAKSVGSWPDFNCSQALTGCLAHQPVLVRSIFGIINVLSVLLPFLLLPLLLVAPVAEACSGT